MELLTTSAIEELKTRVLRGGEVSHEEASALAGLDEPGILNSLFSAAHEITVHFHGSTPELCSLVNAKSHLCAEDCKFCSQSVHYQTSASRYGLLPVDKIVESAKEAEQFGAACFCIVTSGETLEQGEFDTVIEAVKRLKRETSLEIDASVGFLTVERAKELKTAGVRRVNNNVQTARRFYPHIVSTHSYERRLEALRNLKEAGLELCAGGIFGLGETREDRIRMAFELKSLKPECIPINLLNPRPGTPLENMPKLGADEIIKTVAIYRLVHPRAIIKLAGGRELNLAEKQKEALYAGANGLIIGGYLTTESDPVQQDLELVKQAGYSIKEESEKQNAEDRKNR